VSTLNLRHFSPVGVLKRVDFDSLVRLLRNHALGYLEARGISLAVGQDAFAYDDLHAALIKPEVGFPEKLADALFFINEMSTPEGMDDLLDDIEKSGLAIDVGYQPTPADVALQVWLQDPKLLERHHAEQHLTRPRSFEYYIGAGDGPVPPPSHSQKELDLLASDMDDWFDKKKRGRHTSVFAFPQDDGVWFLVRHGAPMDRRGIIDPSGDTGASFERPEKFDVLVFDPQLNELRVNASSIGEKRLYRDKWGLHFFGDKAYFKEGPKYTLAPLEKGPDSISCEDFDGIEWVKLTEVHFTYGGAYSERVVRKATDYFALLEFHGRPLRTARAYAAKFQVKFTQQKNPRTLTLKLPSIAQFTRDEDSTVLDAWLQRRGFLRTSASGDGA